MTLYRTTAFPILLAALLSLPASAAETAFGRQAAGAIVDRIAAKDCSGAVEDLKAGLKRGFDEVSLLAGSMYDNGVCVRRDWDRAVAFYAKAWDGGMKEAADRLAAGYAAPENGGDIAAALWWANRGRGQAGQAYGIKNCTVGATAVDDPDRMVEEMKSWEPARLTSCKYMLGVMSTMAAEVKYPAVAQRYGIGGSVVLRFMPGVPRIEIEKSDLREFEPLSRNQGDMTRERATKTIARFEKTINEVAERALRRYPNPGGIEADTAISVRYVFTMD